MATLYIKEFAELARDAKGNVIPAGLEPPVAEQVEAIGATSSQSNTLNAATRFVEIVTDANCHYKVGDDPEASTSTAYMAAGQSKFFGVQPGQSMKIAVIQSA